MRAGRSQLGGAAGRGRIAWAHIGWVRSVPRRKPKPEGTFRRSMGQWVRDDRIRWDRASPELLPRIFRHRIALKDKVEPPMINDRIFDVDEISDEGHMANWSSRKRS